VQVWQQYPVLESVGKQTKFSHFYPRLIYSEIREVSGLASPIVTITNLLPNLLPSATNTPTFGVTEPNPTPTHTPNLKECGRYTLYAHNPSLHFVSQYQGRVAGFVRKEAQSSSVMLSGMRKAIGMEDEVSQNPDVNGLDRCVGRGRRHRSQVQPLSLTHFREALWALTTC
jgi:hypothetical protein